MKLEELERRAAALRSAHSGASLVILNGDQTWTAAWGVPQRLRNFRTQEEAVDYLLGVSSPDAPLIIIDL